MLKKASSLGERSFGQGLLATGLARTRPAGQPAALHQLAMTGKYKDYEYWWCEGRKKSGSRGSEWGRRECLDRHHERKVAL